MHKRVSETRSSKASAMGTPSNTCSNHQSLLWTYQSTYVECGKLHKGNAGRSSSNHLEQSYQLSSPNTKQNSLLTLIHQPNPIILAPDVGKSTPGGTQAYHAYNQLSQYYHIISHYTKVCQATLPTNKPTSCRARNKITKNVYD